MQLAAPTPLSAQRPSALRGRLAVPGDALLSQFALFAAALARGETVIRNLCESDAVIPTIRALDTLGVRFDRLNARWHVSGLGAGGLLEPTASLDFTGAPVGLLLALGLVAPFDFTTRFVGAGPVPEPAFGYALDVVEAFGAGRRHRETADALPLSVHGPALQVPASLVVPSGAALAKDAALLAAMSNPGRNLIRELQPGSAALERLLLSRGARIVAEDLEDGSRRIAVDGLPVLRGGPLEVPADPVLAGFGLLAGLVVPGGEITVEPLSMHPEHLLLAELFGRMGARLAAGSPRQSGGNEIASLTGFNTPLTGMVVTPEETAALGEALPALAVAASFAEGATIFHGLGSEGWIDMLAVGLQANGVALGGTSDTLVIYGSGSVPGGAVVETGGQPLVALAFLLLGLGADNPVAVTDAGGVEGRFPGFLMALAQIGARFREGAGT